MKIQKEKAILFTCIKLFGGGVHNESNLTKRNVGDSNRHFTSARWGLQQAK